MPAQSSSAPAASPSTNSAPAVSSCWRNPDADGEITLTDQDGRTRHLSRVEALRLAARIQTVVKGNRALDEKLKALHEHMK